MNSMADEMVEVQSRVVNVWDLVTDQLVQSVKATDEYVRANPWTAVGAAALTAVAAGLLLAQGARHAHARRGNDEVAAEVAGG